MTNVPQEYVEIDDVGSSDFLELDKAEECPLLEIGDFEGIDQPGDANIDVESGPDYVTRAKQLYGPLGAPRKFITFAAGILMRLDALKDPRCTQERERMLLGELAACVDAALTELVVNIILEVNQVSALALEIRSLAPDIYDRWVKLQFTTGKPLSMLTAKRNALDPSRDQLIEEQLRRGKLAAGSVLTAPAQLENFVGIVRLTLEADLNVKTLDEQMELDMALNSFVTARRISFAARSLIAPAGPQAKGLAEAVRMLTQAKEFDKSYQVTIDRMRVRNRRKLKTVQVAAEKRVTVSATARTERPDLKVAM